MIICNYILIFLITCTVPIRPNLTEGKPKLNPRLLSWFTSGLLLE